MDVVIVAKIDKGVIAVALFHVDKVDYLNVVPLGVQQVPRVPQQLALGIKANKAGVGVHNVGFRKKPRLASAGAAADQNVEIAAVFASVQADSHILRQYLVGGGLFVCVLLPECCF